MSLNKKSWRFAIVGLGAATRTIHLPALSQLATVEIVGGFDTVGKMGLPFPVFGDFTRMLLEVSPDVVVIATPPAFHYEYARQSLEFGCHVFCEKPVTSTLGEAKSLSALSAHTGRALVVNNQYRYMKIHSRPHSLLGTDSFGRLNYLKLLQTFRRDEDTEKGWRGRQIRRTCLEFGTHAIDLCRYFFQSEPVRMTASMPRHSEEDPDLLNLIQLDFPGNRIAHVELNRLTRGPHRYLELRLDGSLGCIETKLGGGLSIEMGIQGGTRRPYLELDASLGGWARLYKSEKYRTIARESLNPFSDATSRLLQDVLAALLAGEEPPCHINDNIKTLSLVLDAYRQAGYGD